MLDFHWRGWRWLLVLLILPVVAAADAAQEAMPMPAYRAIAGPEVPACARVEDAYFDHVVLIGDSLADGLGIHQVVPELQLLSRIGMTPRSALEEAYFKNDGKPVTLNRKLPYLRPRAVYIWLGANALVGTAEDRVIRDYERLLQRLMAAAPDVPFLLVEVTPVLALTATKYADFTNERIDTFNALLHDLAARHGAYILPVNALLKDGAGLLDEAYANDDGIHLRKAAYEALADYLYTHALPLGMDDAPREKKEAEQP